MKVQKKFDLFAVILLISFFLVPCLFVHSADAEELKVLRWGSSSVGASNYNWCAGVSNLINKYTDYSLIQIVHSVFVPFMFLKLFF